MLTKKQKTINVDFLYGRKAHPELIREFIADFGLSIIPVEDVYEAFSLGERAWLLAQPEFCKYLIGNANVSLSEVGHALSFAIDNNHYASIGTLVEEIGKRVNIII